jgi:enoyl-CoA hydratase/carnithine racemase
MLTYFKSLKMLGTSALATTAAMSIATASDAADPSYFTKYDDLHMSRDARGVLVVELTTNGGPMVFGAKDHHQFADAFYDISRDRDNKVIILTGAGGQWVSDIDFASFGNVADPDNWSRIQDDGVQSVENFANIRAPVICAVEGHAWVHTEFCLMSDVVIAGKSASFLDAPHFAGGIVPGDGIFATWSYRAGAGRAEAFLLNPKPISADTAKEWGVVADVVSDGTAVQRARELAVAFLAKPEVTRRNTRALFIQPLKLALIEQVGYGHSLEGASASALVKASTQGK